MKDSTFVLDKRRVQLLLVNSVDYSEPKGTGLVGARRHHASALGRTADHHRLAAQFRIIALFDGGVIGIQVDMQDNAPFSLGLFHTFFHCSRLTASSASY